MKIKGDGETEKRERGKRGERRQESGREGWREKQRAMRWKMRCWEGEEMERARGDRFVDGTGRGGREMEIERGRELNRLHSSLFILV